MISKDVIEQLIGPIESWDQMDTMAFVIYNVTHEGKTYPSANVNFEKGVVEFYNEDDDVVLKFAIKATLEPITE